MSYPDISKIHHTFIDFEASSLNQTVSFPISVGIVHQGKAYYWLIKPKNNWTDWDKKAEQLHGLSKEFLIANGIEADEIIEKITWLLGTQCTLYSDNPYWERFWLNRLGISNYQIADAYDLVKPGREEYVEATREVIFEENNLTPHNAIDDVIALALAVTMLSL
tara:strand:+ start:1956 stop:2447 length:492 start_codon:yes stop_codon:yes gene_type:complete